MIIIKNNYKSMFNKNEDLIIENMQYKILTSLVMGKILIFRSLKDEPTI